MPYSSGFTEEEETDVDAGRGKIACVRFSHGERAGHRSTLGISVIHWTSEKCFGEFFKAVLGLFVQFGGGSREISLGPSLH